MTENNNSKAHIIVVSNEKGGTGKSTISMHLAVKLLNEGFSVAALDMDGRQGTLSKYIENRKNFCRSQNINLPIPEHYRFSAEDDIDATKEKIKNTIPELCQKFDAIIIDTPGSRNHLFDEAHLYADTVITPISDSLIDLNVMAEIDFLKKKIGRPGHYASFIWDVKKNLAQKNKSMLNWIVVGNKTSNINSRNKDTVFNYLEQLSKLYGFRLNTGLKDRVIYKELFLEGLTVLDMKHDELKLRMSISHLAAKREIRQLAEFICP